MNNVEINTEKKYEEKEKDKNDSNETTIEIEDIVELTPDLLEFLHQNKEIIKAVIEKFDNIFENITDIF